MSLTDAAISAGERPAGTDQAWSLDPRVVLRVVPDEGVYALRGETAVLLRGAAYEAVAPLIDGRRSSDDLVDALTGSLPAAEVYFAIQGMLRRRYLVPTAAADQLAEQAWWLELGADPDAAAREVRSSIQIHATSGVDRAIVDAAAECLEAGTPAAVTTGAPRFHSKSPGLLLVFAGDYTDHELAEVNRDCLATGVPWLLVWPGARQLWLGPLFRPAASPCWECLMARRRPHRRVSSFLSALPGGAAIVMPTVTTPAAAQLTGRIAALEVLKILGGLPRPDVEGAPHDSAVLTELDIVDWHAEHHVVVRRPQCPACGDPTPSHRRPSIQWPSARMTAHRETSAPLRRSRPTVGTGTMSARSPVPQVFSSRSRCLTRTCTSGSPEPTRVFPRVISCSCGAACALAPGARGRQPSKPESARWERPWSGTRERAAGTSSGSGAHSVRSATLRSIPMLICCSATPN